MSAPLSGPRGGPRRGPGKRLGQRPGNGRGKDPRGTESPPLRLGAVVITMGDRPDELRDLLDSVAKQQGPPIEVAVVGNGSPLPPLPGEPRTAELPDNLGIPGGRNVGVELFGPGGSEVDAVLFLDDDGLLPRPDTGALVRAAFTADPELGIISFRIRDPDTGATQRRHVPRLRAGNPLRDSRVTTFLGGACAVRTQVIRQVGPLPESFFYAHEETDLAWRALDAGWQIEYRSELVLHHPATSPARHAVYYRMVARNRVWLARRNLPWPLVPLYLGVWFALTLLRRPSPRALRAWIGGFREGCTAPCGERRPMRWRTVWRLTRLGRPPII